MSYWTQPVSLVFKFDDLLKNQKSSNKYVHDRELSSHWWSRALSNKQKTENYSGVISAILGATRNETSLEQVLMDNFNRDISLLFYYQPGVARCQKRTNVANSA